MHSGDAVRPMQARDLPRVLEWRNNPAIRAAMFSEQVIGMDDHVRWFDAAAGDPTRHLLIFEAEGVALGFLQFRGNAGGEATWGFYAAPGAPRGTGRRLGTAGLDHAFGALGFQAVQARVRSDNAASLGFHRALGFVETGRVAASPGEGPEGGVVVCFRLQSGAWMRPR